MPYPDLSFSEVTSAVVRQVKPSFLAGLFSAFCLAADLI